MIRDLRETDISACLDIYNPYIAESTATFETELLDLDTFAQRVRKITAVYPWLVAEEDGKILGYAYLSAFNEREAYRWTADLAIYVDMSKRGRGIGTQLMEGIIRRAAEEGYYQIISLITSENEASLAFHEKAGFIRIAHFDAIGYKAGKWLGVDYYLKKLREPEEDPVPPGNRQRTSA